MKVKVAAIYRVSTERQVKREADEPIPLQRRAVQAFIESRPDWELVREYAEEGVSGYKVSASDRDVLQQALADARAGRWQALVLFKADRLSRNSLEYPLVLDRFRRLGCEVWSAVDEPGGKLLSLDSQMDKFLRFLEGWQAETESKNTSLRVSAAMEQMARQGRWTGGPVPYGYRLNQHRRPGSAEPSLLIQPNEAESIRLMVRLYLEEGLGCKRIAVSLSERRVPQPGGRPWSEQRVRRILQNPLIAGLPAYNRTRQGPAGRSLKNPYDLNGFVLPRGADGSLQPLPALQIVPLDRWLTLMQAMQSRRSTGDADAVVPRMAPRGSNGLLTGLLYCGHCGARLTPDTFYYRRRLRDGTLSTSQRGAYVCETHRRRGSAFCPGQRSFGRKRLESVVLRLLRRWLESLDASDLPRLVAEEAARVGEIQSNPTSSERARAERALSGWLERMDRYLADPEASPFSEAMLNERIREARLRLEEVRRLSETETAERPARPAPASWWACFERGGLQGRRMALGEAISRIVVSRDSLTLHARVLPTARERG